MKPELLFTPADILLPKTDMSKWSVIACDQYTSQPEYWERAKAFIGDAPSTIHMIYPEAYLGKENDETRISLINSTMRQYLEDGIFRNCPDSFIYVEHTMQDGSVRHGLIGKLDLEAYDYSVGSKSLVRATEGTVESRLPARMKIRENAPLELPHVLAMIDDPENLVLGTVVRRADLYETVYDFDLFEGGHIRGRLIPSEHTAPTVHALNTLFSQSSRDSDIAIAIGDGNHSLATAKACFEERKKTMTKKQWQSDPARWALVELINIHDTAVKFEPVHRLVYNTNPIDLLETLRATYPEEKCPIKLEYVLNGNRTIINVGFSVLCLQVETLQRFLDAYLQEHTGTLDYIHDDHALIELTKQPGSIGFLLDALDKGLLIPMIKHSGSLPRKTFSLGHSCEKRYYLEARKITL